MKGWLRNSLRLATCAGAIYWLWPAAIHRVDIFDAEDKLATISVENDDTDRAWIFCNEIADHVLELTKYKYHCVDRDEADRKWETRSVLDTYEAAP